MEKNDLKTEGLIAKIGWFSLRIQAWIWRSTKKGIPSSTLKSKWRNLLLMLQNFITCEGRFGHMYFYHIRMMMHFLEDHQMNLSYFLLNSLRKMAINVQKEVQCIENTMYHHGPVKILVENHLQSIGDDSKSILIRNHFEQKTPEKPSSSRILKGRKITIEMTREHTPQTQTKVIEEELPIVKILQRMKRGNPRKKKASPGKEELSQIETSSRKGKSKNKRRKV